MESSIFMFDLGQKVVIKISGEVGEINGRAQYLESANLYRLHYKSADGKATSDWFEENQISLSAS